MKKHSSAMVFLLILTLILVGVVSASDIVCAAEIDQLSLNQEDNSMEITGDVELLDDDSEDYISEGSADGIPSEDLDGPVSVGDGAVAGQEDDSGDVISLDNDEPEAVQASADEDSYSDEDGSVSVEGGVVFYEEDSEDEKTEYGAVEGIVLGASSDLDDFADLNIIYSDPPSTAYGLNLIDDDTYLIGYKVTTAADKLLNFNCADDILVITTARLTKINNLTTEKLWNGIVDASNGYVTKDNLLLLSSKRNSMDIAFFIKEGESLIMAFYGNGCINPLFSGDVGPNLSAGLWEILENSLGIEDASRYLAIADSWADGLSGDDLAFDTCQRPLSTGLVSGETLSSPLFNYYPPNEFDLPLGNTRDDMMGASRDSDDNALIWNTESISGKTAYVGVDMVNESEDGFLRSANGKTQEVIAAGDVTPSGLKRIGVEATKRALAYFKSKGIEIQKDYPYLYVLTSAGYVEINGMSTEAVLDGILEVLGNGFEGNLFSIHTPLWKDLVFYFLWVNSTNDQDFLSYGLRYVASSGRLSESDTVKKQGDDMAYDFGFYEKPSESHPDNNRHYSDEGYCSNCYVPSFENVLPHAAAGNMTQVKNQTDNRTNKSAANVTGTSKNNYKPVKEVENKHGSPYNILFTIAAIILIFVIFGIGNSKRFD